MALTIGVLNSFAVNEVYPDTQRGAAHSYGRNGPAGEGKQFFTIDNFA
jgi:hypothetical protein